ncbi:hypothetical protein GGR56DRAFT_656241 [Xylariaceae sp. FL0804]|nr:hypothetical protein GGR56DRAFT_656241 [Xylariaceae sp. FL0804]
MGRLGPLTSLALGRSPYDDVEEGTGQDDPHEPEKQYDSTGRIVNPETKKINRDIIRAHNEVMLVIGVAEPENPGITSAEAESARRHHQYESRTGNTLMRFGRLVSVAGTWGLHGIRQRILVYRETAGLPFLQLLHQERQEHSLIKLGFSGIPTYVAIQAIQSCSGFIGNNVFRDVLSYGGFQSAMSYIQFHAQIFVALQHLGLISPSQWLPGVEFFIPFSASSPFSAPPPPQSLDTPGISRWLGRVALGLAPFAASYLASRALKLLSYGIRHQLLRYLPKPLPSLNYSPRPATPPGPSRRQTFPESPTLGAADREIRHTQEPDTDLPTAVALDDPVNGDLVPLGAFRRQSTFSSRAGEEYATDEEDADTVNPTLISFDVDTSESMEPPAGVWSAELRPSINGDGRPVQKETLKYVVNPLTLLPSLLAGHIIANSLAHVLLTPVAAYTARAMARAYAQKMGLPVGHILSTNLLDGLSTRMVLNLFNIEMLKFFVSTDIWAFFTVLSQWLHVTDEEWKEFQEAEAEEASAGDASSQ